MDVFRVFDSLNYAENMKLGIDAVGQAGGIVEAAICYTGDITDPKRGRYNLDYYLDFARTLVGLGAHVICIKDMAGLLKPEAASMLVGALREAYPHIPVHVHTHDTAMTGVASMLAAAAAGADAVDVATDALSGTTSQPSLGAVANAVRGTKHDTGLDLDLLNDVNDYWEEARGLYAPFESGQKSGSSDVHRHEMPGGQYTNLLFQSTQLGLTGQWSSVKKAYGEANKVLGDIIKVTPSSKVTGDLAQFMVANNLNGEQVVEQAETLSFPTSVVEYMQGYLGLPPFGFPEPFRTRVLKGKTLPEDPTKTHFDGRPGAELQPIDFEGTYTYLTEQHSARLIKDVDVMSHVMYVEEGAADAAAAPRFCCYCSSAFAPTTPAPPLLPTTTATTATTTTTGTTTTLLLLLLLLLLPTHPSPPRYPAVFKDFMANREKFGDLSKLDTRTFLTGLQPGQEVAVEIEAGKTLIVRLVQRGETDADGFVDVLFELNGANRVIRVKDKSAAVDTTARAKADPNNPQEVGASMPGVVVEAKVSIGDSVEAGDPLVVLSAMKMESVIASPVSGVVRHLPVASGDSLAAGDLIATVE
jgi:pyruvate carboxylase